MKAYPVGWPFWKEAARAGLPIGINVSVLRDEEAGVYVACNSNLKGLVAEAATLDELRVNIEAATDDLLEHYLSKVPARSMTLAAMEAKLQGGVEEYSSLTLPWLDAATSDMQSAMFQEAYAELSTMIRKTAGAGLTPDEEAKFRAAADADFPAQHR